MSDSRHKQLSSAISHTIASYELTSRSKSLRRLSSKNVDKITKSIIDTKQNKQLMELIKKKDYYMSKIHELLNESGEETDPCCIIDEEEAEHYIRKRLLKDHDKVQQIKDLINRHKSFQEVSVKEQDRIMTNHSRNRSSLRGLKKLGALNAATETRLNAEKEMELANFYNRLSQKQLDYSSESEKTLGHLGVPFFVLSSVSFEATRVQKSFILDLLYKILQEEL